MPEEKIGHYLIRKEIGRGGMGAVYLASDPKLGRDVALKILPPFMAKDDERMARFQREAEILASLNHPNIGAIYGLEDTVDSRALVLELVEGPTLAERINAGPIPIDEALAIVVQIAQAVEAAHEKGIVHRDLKPSNVKVTPEGRVKVLDFGLAKAVEGERRDSSQVDMSHSPTITGAMTGINVILGTAAYMSPEQARGAPVDRRADIWAFGVILYEMLTGKPLFSSETVSDTLASVLKVDPNWKGLPDETPPRIRRLLRRCLTRDPRRRLRDMGDARLMIEEEQSGVPDESAAVAAPAAATPARRPWMVTAVAVAAAAIAAAGVWGLRPAGPEMPLRKFIIPLDPSDPNLSGGVMPVLSPDGTHLAYVSQGSLWIRDLSRFEGTEVAGSAGARRPFWSPDGEWIAFGLENKILKVSRGGGNPIPIAALGPQQRFTSATGAAWGEDGRVVFCSGGGGLWEVSAQGGDPKILHETAESEMDFHEVNGLPEGKGWVFVVHRQAGGYNTLGILGADGTRRDILTHEGMSLADPVYSSTGHILYRRSPTATGLWALRFSLSEMAPIGEPFLVAADAGQPGAAGDGTLVFVQGGGAREYRPVWYSRDGKMEATLGEPSNFWLFPSLSPDAGRIAIRIGDGDNRNQWILDVARGTRSRLTFFTERVNYASWNRDGTRLYAFRFGGGEDPWTMFVLNPDGSGEPRDIGRGLLPFPTPDETQLIYSDTEGNRSDLNLYILPLDAEDAEPVPFLNTTAEEWWGQPSPDGKYLLYVSDESGRDEVFLTTFPEPRGKWQVSVDGGHWPRWRGDGREIFFASGDDITAVEVDLTSGVRLGSPRVLFTREATGSGLPWPDGFDVTADGQRFVLLQAAETEDGKTGPTPGIAVVQNWLKEFE